MLETLFSAQRRGTARRLWLLPVAVTLTHVPCALASEMCPPDLNDDHIIDAEDLGLLLGLWGTTGPSEGDLNNDLIVDGADLGLLLAQWGICENVPTHANLVVVRDMLTGASPDHARALIIGDSQSSMSVARLYASIIRTWEPTLDFGALPAPPTIAAPFSTGFSSIAVSPASEAAIKPADTFSTGLHSIITQSEEFTIPTLGSGVPIAHFEMRQNSNLNSKWINTPIQARLVYQDGGPGIIDSFQYQLSAGGVLTTLTPVTTNSGGYAMLHDTLGPSPAALTRLTISSNAPISARSFINHGVLYLETESGAPVTDRPWIVGNIYLAGSRLSEWATGSLTTTPGTFSWSNLGDYLDALTLNDSEWPNLILISLGHNDGPSSPSPASLNAHFLSLISQIDSLYTSRAIPPPQYLFSQLWCTDTIDNTYWKSAWVSAWLPLAGGRVSVASVSALHGFQTHNGIELSPNHLDAFGVHPADSSSADFYFGPDGLLGIILNATD
ncbi:MAG: hypothetical protein ACF8GE_05885 [Phycisphaerales bacterium JB043]